MQPMVRGWNDSKSFLETLRRHFNGSSSAKGTAATTATWRGWSARSWQRVFLAVPGARSSTGSRSPPSATKPRAYRGPSMPAVTKSPVLTLFWRVHRFLLRVTKGRFFTRLGSGRQLLLLTKGRKSGERRSVGLTYIKDDERFVVIASNAGDDRHPAWWLNLLSDPNASVTVDGRSIPVTARESEEPERGRLFSRFVNEIDQAYAEYQQRTNRRLPVITLTPKP